MNILEKLLDFFGISVMPHAIGLSKFNISKPISPLDIKEIKTKIQKFTKKNADEALKYCKELFDIEMARGEKIESKAYNLISVTGLFTAFVTGISGLLPENAVEIFPWQNVSLTIIYILIVVSLTFTLLLSTRAVIVGEYKFAYPDISGIFNDNSKSQLSIKRERLNDYLYCYNTNHQIHNIKGSYLIGSQKWFRNTIILFLLLAFLLAPSVFGNLSINL